MGSIPQFNRAVKLPKSQQIHIQLSEQRAESREKRAESREKRKKRKEGTLLCYLLFAICYLLFAPCSLLFCQKYAVLPESPAAAGELAVGVRTVSQGLRPKATMLASDKGGCLRQRSLTSLMQAARIAIQPGKFLFPVENLFPAIFPSQSFAF
jgi:hypothetical protein